jgi:hypothetical protein
MNYLEYLLLTYNVVVIHVDIHCYRAVTARLTDNVVIIYLPFINNARRVLVRNSFA